MYKSSYNFYSERPSWEEGCENNLKIKNTNIAQVNKHLI